MDTTRRNFLRAGAATAAIAVTGRIGLSARPVHAADLPTGLDKLTWDKAPCRFCGTGCHVQVGVKAGKVVAVTGDRKAPVNKGLLCAKGYHLPGILYGKDRLTQPMLRVDGKLQPISWDKAIDVIAERVMTDDKGFAVYGSGQWTIPEGYINQKFMKGGLANNHIDPNARLCMASAVTGFIAAYGVDEPAGVYDDIDACDVMICWGNNPAEMHPILFSRFIDRRAQGDKITLIDIGTRRTRTTKHAKHFLQFTPHSDLAIANGILHLLLKNDTWDKDFVGKHCAFRKDPEPGKFTLKGVAASFEEWSENLEKYTPEYVSEISGVPADDIRMLGKIFGDPKIKITSLWCMGANQHTRGTAINTLLHAIHLFSGKFGSPGNAPTSLTGQPSACGTAREVGTLAHALPGGRIVAKEAHRKHCEDQWKLPHGRIDPKPGYHTVKMWEKFTTPSDQGGDISTIWVQVTNPGQTLPNLKKLFNSKQGLKDKFLIVSDVYPTATTKLADLVLPSAMWVEKNGIFGNSERRTQQWFKQVDPPGEARDDVWQVLAVARKLHDEGYAGMKDKDGQFLFHMTDEAGNEVPAWDWAHFADINVDRALFEDYRPLSYLKHKNLPPYDVLVKHRGLRWPVVEKDGVWRETRWRFAEFDDPFVEKGKGFQFYHSTSGDDRAQIWLRHYEPPPEVPDTDYPFWLCTGRVLEHWHSGTMTMRVGPLRESMPQAYVEINKVDAKRLGIGEGEDVVLETRRGKLTLPAWIRGRGTVPIGSLFVPFFDERLLINDLTLDAHDPISKQPDYKKCAARVTKAG